MAYNDFIKKIMNYPGDKLTRAVITADEWNDLWQLSIEQGNHSEEALETLFNRVIITKDPESILTNDDTKMPTSAAVLTKLGDYVKTSVIEQTLTDNPNKLPSSKAVLRAMETRGFGDMLSEVYDSDNAVKNAGGIAAYVAGEIPEPPAPTPFLVTGSGQSGTFSSDTTLTDYSFKGSVNVAGLTANDKVYVELTPTQVNAGIYAPVTNSRTDYFDVYASEDPGTQNFNYTIIKAVPA